MRATRRPCGVCGTTTQAPDSVCQRCKRSDRWAPNVALIGGRWVTIRGVQHWQPHPPKELTLAELAALAEAHAGYARGLRDDATRQGERDYQRARKREQRRQQREAA